MDLIKEVKRHGFIVKHYSERIKLVELDTVVTILADYISNQVDKPVKPEIAEEMEKQFLERQLAKIEVLSCKGDVYGKHLPTKILLQLGKETKWFIRVD